MLKPGLNGIILILLIAVVLAISGCSGSETDGTATPTPQPGDGNATGTPTAAPAVSITPTPAPAASEPTSVGHLYSIGDLNSYMYRLTNETNGQEQISIITISFADTTYNGVEARRIHLNIDAPATGETGAGQFLIDIYMRKSDNSTLGGHIKMTINGQPLEYDIPADEVAEHSKYDLASDGLASGHTPLTKVGPDTVTIDGKTYDCTKYTYIEDGITHTVWHTPGAPMPVKIQWTEGDSSNTMVLLSWS